LRKRSEAPVPPGFDVGRRRSRCPGKQKITNRVPPSFCDVTQTSRAPDPTFEHAICAARVGVARELQIPPWQTKCRLILMARTSHRSRRSRITFWAGRLLQVARETSTFFLNNDARFGLKPARWFSIVFLTKKRTDDEIPEEPASRGSQISVHEVGESPPSTRRFSSNLNGDPSICATF
jgi:hypothetical protein